MNVGKRIYYDKITGDILVDTGEFHGAVTKKTVEQDISTYKALSDRNREMFDVIELEIGQYAQDFAECNGYRVNVETTTLEFSYPDPNTPEEPSSYQIPLSEEVEMLKVAQAETDTTLLELMEVILLG